MKSLYALLWLYIAAFGLALYACHNAGVRDPERIRTIPVVLP